MKGLWKFVWGLLLLPWTIATFYHLPSLIFSSRAYWVSVAWLFSGAVCYLFIEAVFDRPMRTYVFGHELTHALASILMGGSVHSFNVSKHGGSVTLSKSNFFVALAPYCVPIYTIPVLIAYPIFLRWRPFPHLQETFQFLIGLTLAFHASLTFFAIRQEQPDIKKTGFFFSMVFIALVNAWFVVLLSKVLFWNLVYLRGFLFETFKTQGAIWVWAGQKIWTVSKWGYEWGKDSYLARRGVTGQPA